VIVVNAGGLQRIPNRSVEYYQRMRTDLALGEHAPGLKERNAAYLVPLRINCASAAHSASAPSASADSGGSTPTRSRY
jgi:hypothetical protein